MKNWKLVGNKGTIRKLNENTCSAHVNDTNLDIVFPLDELHQWVERLEITQTQDGAIRMSTWGE